MLGLDSLSCFALPLAFILDALIGDPVRLPHPIRWMGYTISLAESAFRRLALPLTASGILFAVTLASGTWSLTWILLHFAGMIHPSLGVALDIILIFYCLAVKSLDQAARSVYRSLENGDLDQAKQRVSYIVGRQVDKLDKSGVSRATVETVAENFVDGIVSPLFFAVIGGAPLCMAFKMISTMDSMVGYKNDQYHLFGKCAARLDDAANYIPARLSVPIIAAAAQLLGNTGKRTFRTAFRDGRNHTSPNAGLPEAAFAGALGVKLGGPNFYHGGRVDKPYIGAEYAKTGPRHILRALDLMIISSLFAFVLLWGFFILLKMTG